MSDSTKSSSQQSPAGAGPGDGLDRRQLLTAAAGLAASLGLRLSEGPVSGVQVKSVLAGGAAHRAGVAAGDELLAVDGWRIRRLDEAQGWLAADAPFELLLVRDQRVLALRVQPLAAPPVAEAWSLQLQARPPAAVRRRRQGWLGT